MAQNYSFNENKANIKRKYWWQIAIIFILIFFIVLVNLKQQNQANFIEQYIELPEAYENFETDIPEDYTDWNSITTQDKDTLSKVFERLNISQQTLYDILKDNPHQKQITNVKPDQQIRALVRDNVLNKLIMPYSATELITITKCGNKYKTQIESRVIDSHQEFLNATIKKSLYQTAKDKKIPYTLIQQMAKIFEWEVDFSKDIHPGDSFNIIYESFYVENTKVNTGKILAAEYKSGNRVYQAIAHENKNGDLEYYTPEGHSLKKAFSRYPLKFSHISSSFSLARKHPILNYIRAHKGIDLAARMGTPIHATGDGRIKNIGTHHGYGNMIKIAHNKIYASVYAHLSRFEKGLKRGDYVKRGQVIGYVGQTGLATAPHCHYEFHVNQRAQNPATIKLPQADSINKNELANFSFKANQLIASLKLYAESNLAQSKGSKQSETG